MSSKKERILLLMSGGVDSSVCVLLLKDFYDIIGVTMRIPNSSTHVLAQSISKQLGIFHITVESEKIFSEKVIDKYTSSKQIGLTPNPCVDCNRALKFDIIPKIAEKMLGTQGLRIASGHYASIICDMDHKYICRASDVKKDQSYFLCDLPSDVVQRILFPLGKMNKQMVRDIARQANLETAEKPESMDTCFCVPNENINSNKKGIIFGTNGKVMGEHKGTANYTIGQRKGLRIAAKKPLYVLHIDAINNIIIVGDEDEAYKKDVYAVNTNNLTDKTLEHLANKKLFGKTRSRGEPSPCRIININPDNFLAEFDEPQFAPTPGQRLVCYNEYGALLLSGVIANQFTVQP
jgi:tRNA-specific 2-thiouridylase